MKLPPREDAFVRGTSRLLAINAAPGAHARLILMTARNAAAERQNGPGCLYLVGTPIGNLEDITLRALRILKEADQIACEDTRHTQKLLTHYDIHKPLVSYHEHNELKRAAELAAAMEQGAKIALVSDAGMPLVSDPGHQLVALCLERQIPVVPIPGPSALLTALSGSGMPTEEFLFVGFLPARSGERRRALECLRIEERTIILYEAPHRVAECISDALEILGNRPGCLAREVTKIHEEFLRGKLSEILASLEERSVRGEITLILGPPGAAEVRAHGNSSQTLAARVEELMQQAKLDRKEALKLAAKERGLTRRAAYSQLVGSHAGESRGRDDA
ncbi:MAG TPA: 16S rRNA (cytidine(1402)-2'-O)-methyltransferase [Candidatus Acidoferrum sp.]|nr:16S rRNA (cytidine(1402)-2'-O)-methyltransferase [Candidatus Acidoferrum sp.]